MLELNQIRLMTQKAMQHAMYVVSFTHYFVYKIYYNLTWEYFKTKAMRGKSQINWQKNIFSATK